MALYTRKSLLFDINPNEPLAMRKWLAESLVIFFVWVKYGRKPGFVEMHDIRMECNLQMWE